MQELNQIVRETEQFRVAEAEHKVTRALIEVMGAVQGSGEAAVSDGAALLVRR